MENGQPTIQHLLFCKNLSEAESAKLPFRKPVFPDASNAWLVEQAGLYRMARTKIPDWWHRGDLVFPDKIALEQASSDVLARWKATLLPENTERLVDVSAGLGVDAFFMGASIPMLILFEPGHIRAAALRYNFHRIRQAPFEVRELRFSVGQLGDIPFSQKRTVVYADPDRRSEDGLRVEGWQESKPSVKEVYTQLQSHDAFLMVKFSPMDDPEQIIRSLPGAGAVYVVSIHNEVKEVLIYWDFRLQKERPPFYAVDFHRQGGFSQVLLPSESEHPVQFEKPVEGAFLLDPWAAIRKGNRSVFLALEKGWGILSVEARLFLQMELPSNFPGRVFRIERVVDSLSAFAQVFHEKRIHVVSRNFPQSAEDIQKKYRWIPGGDLFLFCYQDPSGHKKILLTRRPGHSNEGQQDV